ncbi:ribonuclease H-like domain-containing protein [Tanacetum coccineum]
MKCPQHYLTDMQEVILFYNGLDVLTRQILDSKGVIPSKTAADAKVAIQEMAEYSQKWHNGTSLRTRGTKTSNGLAAIQAQLNNLGREIKKVNEKVHAAQGIIEQQGQDSTNEIMETLHEQGLARKRFKSLPNATKTNPRDQVKSISTARADFSEIRHIRHEPYAVSGTQHRSLFSKTIPFPGRQQNFGCDDWIEAHDVKILDAYDHSLPQKEKDPGSITSPHFISDICFDKALVDLGASVSVMPFSTYTNLGLEILSHTRLTIELADRTIKQPRGIAENVLVKIGKFIFPIDFVIFDIPEDNDIPLILGRPFLSTAHSKIDVFKRKITLMVGEEKLIFKSIKPATSIIKRVFVIKSLDSKMNFIREGDVSFDPTYGDYLELNDLETPLETKMDQDDGLVPIFVKTESYKIEFSCVIRYKYVIADLLPSLPINLMSKSFYYSISGDKDEGESQAETLIDIPVFVGSFSIILGFTFINDNEMTNDVVLGMRFCKKYTSCQRIKEKFALGCNYERIMR